MKQTFNPNEQATKTPPTKKDSAHPTILTGFITRNDTYYISVFVHAVI